MVLFLEFELFTSFKYRREANSEWPKQQPMISKQNHENKCYKVIIIIHNWKNMNFLSKSSIYKTLI